ncbi:MAG TPA: MFS transporter [Terracidiphilus sp.]|nr:MFS transporter [Terracidiphilus sp.]
MLSHPFDEELSNGWGTPYSMAPMTDGGSPISIKTNVPAATAFSWSAATTAQRRVVIAASLGWMLDAFDVMLYSIVLATLMRAFGMSRTTAGLLNALTLIASAVGGLIFGVLADRLGRRRMLSASILIYSVFTFACGLSTSIAMLAACRFLLGLGMGGEWNTGAALVAETWPSALRGRALGIVQSSWAVGYAISAVVAGAILAHGSWRWVFFAGILPAGLVFWIQSHVPETPLWERLHAGDANVRTRGKVRGSVRALVVLTATNTFGMFGWWGLFTWIPAYLVLPVSQGGRGFAALSLTGFLVTVNLAGMLPGYLLFGVFADRFGRKRTFVVYLAAAAAAVPLLAGAREPGWILVFACVAAFFGTGFFTGSGIIGSEIFPTESRATALGISYNVARGLSALAPVTIGALSERHGLAWAFGASAVAFAAAACVALLLKETRGVELA